MTNETAGDRIDLNGKAAGRAAGILIAHRKADAEPVAHKLDIRAQILRDIAPAVGSSTTGHPLDLPTARQRNLEWAADELEAAAEIIRRLAIVVPRTAKDALNGSIAESFALALKMIRENERGESWSAGLAMSALASAEESGWRDAAVGAGS